MRGPSSSCSYYDRSNGGSKVTSSVQQSLQREEVDTVDGSTKHQPMVFNHELGTKWCQLSAFFEHCSGFLLSLSHKQSVNTYADWCLLWQRVWQSDLQTYQESQFLLFISRLSPFCLYLCTFMESWSSKLHFQSSWNLFNSGGRVFTSIFGA